jgi:hypothetical protein
VVIEDAKGIVAGDESPLVLDESDSITEAPGDEIGAVWGAKDSLVGGCGGASRLAVLVLAVNGADEGPRGSEKANLASAAESIPVGEVRERYTVVDAEWE